MEKSFEQKVSQLYAEAEIRKLMAKYVYYAYSRSWEKVPGLFASRDDIWVDCEGFGVFEGTKGVETFFVQWHHSMEGDAVGIFSLHLLTTEIIEVAGDGKTARGLWISPGAESRHKAEDNELDAYWIWGLYAIDFINDNGEWKFWHFRIPHLIYCDYHHSWVDVSGIGLGEGVHNDGRPTADRPSTYEPTFYGKEKSTNGFFEPPYPYETEADLKDFWT